MAPVLAGVADSSVRGASRGAGDGGHHLESAIAGRGSGHRLHQCWQCRKGQRRIGAMLIPVHAWQAAAMLALVKFED